MAHKRPFDDEVVDEGSSKHQKQEEPNGDINDNFSLDGASGKFYDIGESSLGKHGMGLCEELPNGSWPVVPREVVEEVESDVPRSVSLSHWATSSTSDEDEPPEDMVQLPFYPGYFSFDHPLRPVINPEDVYRCLLDYPPRKRVPVGPDHQADIPSCGTQVNGITTDDLETTKSVSSDGISSRIVDGEMSGVCIMSFLKTEPLPYDAEKVGCGRAECTCLDQGSIRCVRQHIAEARDKLRKTLGQDIFMELGFDNMGEVVADNWSEEEEQLFHEVVYANPVSLGKNFWNVLSAEFASRTKMEIVSYYFNVFMLRKRAEQNRFDPLNIDSDNDEWHGVEDDLVDEGEVSEEDEDLGIKSPVHQNAPEFCQNMLHLHEDEHEPKDDVNTSEEAQDYNDNNDDVFLRKSDLDSSFGVSGKKRDGYAENDVQDGSCTSSDSGGPVQEPRVKADVCHEWNDYITGSSDVRPWDGFSLSCPKQSVEFLPTCSMIEEVFGDIDFDTTSKRW